MWLRCVLVTTPSDDRRTELLLALAQGDKQAFAELFSDMAPRLRGFFRSSGFQEEADELTQETMLRVWRGASSYDRGKGAPTTWIFTIARNLRIDRRRKRRVAVVDDDPARVADPEEAPDARVDRARQAEDLRDAIRQLPDAQADAVRAVYFEHQSARAFAESSGVAEGTVKSRLRLALRALRGHLDPEGAT